MRQNAIIMGDSYSTFEDYIPTGYAVYYSRDDSCNSGVTKVDQTWWHQVMKEANLNLVQNNSWSGSTIGYTGYGNSDCSKSSSFIYRFKQLVANGFFKENKIDTVFVFGGTNDSWSDAPLGEMQYGNWSHSDLYSVLPAICYLLHLIKETLPHARIYCLINTDIKPEIMACLQEASQKSGIIPITFDSIDKRNNHPTVQGMVDIKKAVLQALK